MAGVENNHEARSRAVLVVQCPSPSHQGPSSKPTDRLQMGPLRTDFSQRQCPAGPDRGDERPALKSPRDPYDGIRERRNGELMNQIMATNKARLTLFCSELYHHEHLFRGWEKELDDTYLEGQSNYGNRYGRSSRTRRLLGVTLSLVNTSPSTPTHTIKGPFPDQARPHTQGHFLGNNSLGSVKASSSLCTHPPPPNQTNLQSCQPLPSTGSKLRCGVNSQHRHMPDPRRGCVQGGEAITISIRCTELQRNQKRRDLGVRSKE